MWNKLILSCGSFLLLGISIFAQRIPPDSTGLALKALHDLQERARKTKNIDTLLQTGCWKEARKAISALPVTAPATRIFEANFAILQNDLEKAEKEINAILKKEPANKKALLLKSYLEVQAWRLPMAVNYAEKVLKTNPDDADALLQKGRVLVWQKNYREALSIATALIGKNPLNAKAYQLEADVYFWDQHPEKAEAPLLKSLALDPFNADARFSYGYAIWRRIDARQLNAMAAQWELALAINPLHYQTHWHWGNGHTNLTYADYAEKDDDSVRARLILADSFIRANQVDSAIAVTRRVENAYPGSIIPLLHRGSIYYSAFDLDRRLRLDSAQKLFETVLARKKHFGPAHNGLSAVIKSKRIPYLAAYDSIMQALRATDIKDKVHFEEVFNDLSYYAGDMANAMVWNQLYTAVVYFPFLSKQNDAFRIPALHIDLATCMQSPYFRFMTTFDNRQWMDIRGVGSGAAAIEYVERGAFLERNVVLHEYVHLFHGDVLTDAENRAVRKHYYKAMQEGRTLDYYSQNNEHEYLAQTYPAYFEPVKVHPLDFKSMNTTTDLKTKDPGMYAFLDSLIKKERAYLDGDKKAMASNWAQVYVNLNYQFAEKDPKIAAAYLDTAIQFDKFYLPVSIAYAQLKAAGKDTAAAKAILDKAIGFNPRYAPLYAAYATLFSTVDEQTKALKEALKYEDDFQERASMSRQLAEVFRKHGKLPEAIATAEQYAKEGATVSTYLRDRRDDAIAYAAGLRADLGYPEPLTTLDELLQKKPQQFDLRANYADALQKNGRYQEAIETLQKAQRILASSGNGRADFDLRISENFVALGKKDSAEIYSKLLVLEKLRENEGKLRYIQLLLKTEQQEKAQLLFPKLSASGDQYYLSDYYYTRALLSGLGNTTNTAADYELAIGLNPYNYAAVKSALIYYGKTGNTVREAAIKKQVHEQAIQPGPAYAL